MINANSETIPSIHIQWKYNWIHSRKFDFILFSISMKMAVLFISSPLIIPLMVRCWNVQCSIFKIVHEILWKWLWRLKNVWLTFQLKHEHIWKMHSLASSYTINLITSLLNGWNLCRIDTFEKWVLSRERLTIEYWNQSAC